MSINNLYKREIIKHYKNPLHTNTLKDFTCKYKLANLSCGDETEVKILIKNKKIFDISHKTNGCSIAIATASIFSNFIIGKNIEEVTNLTLKDIEELLHIELSPARQKCALLILEAVKKAILKSTSQY